MDWGDISTRVTAAYIGLSLISILMVVIILFRLLKGVLRSVALAGTVFGTDMRTRLISFGIAAILFPTVLPKLILVAFVVFMGLFQHIPRSLATNWQASIRTCQTTHEATQCIGQVGFGFMQAWGAAFLSVYSDSNLSGFPYADAVFLLTVWAILGQLLTASKVTEKNGGERSRLWLQEMYARVSPVARANLHFFVILGIAAYLSIAAIAAIPGLQEKVTTTEEESAEKLQDQLKDMPQQPDVKPIEVHNPFRRLDDYLGTGEPASTASVASNNVGTPSSTKPAGVAPTGTQQGGMVVNQITSGPNEGNPALGEKKPAQPPGNPGMRGYLEIALPYQKNQRQELVLALKRLVEDAQQQAKAAQSTALTTYRASNVERKGSRERGQHFLELASWYREGINILDAQLSSCIASIDRADMKWATWDSLMQNMLVSQGSDFTRFEMDEDIYAVSRDALQSCRPVRITGDVPQRPALGSYLGPFAIVASWLVKTESLPLALVVGLFGFGLLGSACSTFVREQAKKSGSGAQPLVGDLSGVVIRGLSAAIVVFLAVEGGLAVFSSGANEPNPYVLLLTCLVAAVFSEEVWDWAHERLRESFRRKEDRRAAERKDEPKSGSIEPTDTPGAPASDAGKRDEPNKLPETGS